MNTTCNTQTKPAKKLKINKEIIGQLTTAEATNRQRGVTLNCSLTC